MCYQLLPRHFRKYRNDLEKSVTPFKVNGVLMRGIRRKVTVPVTVEQLEL